MARAEFDFRLHVSGERELLLPLLPVRLERLGQTCAVEAIIDTGATYSIFRPTVAEALGIPIERGRKLQVTSLREKTVAYLHPIHLSVLGYYLDFEVAFSRDLKFGLDLIGLKPFFDLHQVTFRQYARKIAVTDELT